MTESGLPRVVSIKKLFDEGLGIDETIRLRQGRITGATPEPGTSAAGPLSTAGDSPGLASTPLSGIGPQSPTAGLPAADNGGTITENTTPSTVTGGSGSIGNGGGTPPANGACEPENGDSGDQTATATADAGADEGASRSSRFVANLNGEVILIPECAEGPTPVRSGNGFQFSGGSGGDPLDSRVAGVRIMDPVTSGKYPYPNGYVSYFNETGQTVNPFTGQTIARSDPFWHWTWGP